MAKALSLSQERNIFAKDRCLSGGTGDIVAFGAWLDDCGSRYFHAVDVRATSPAATTARAPD